MSRARDWERAREREAARRPGAAPTLPTMMPPTAKQLRYLRVLAGRTGRTFIQPRTRWDASQEIQRLKT